MSDRKKYTDFNYNHSISVLREDMEEIFAELKEDEETMEEIKKKIGQLQRNLEVYQENQEARYKKLQELDHAQAILRLE